jgi:sigma-B regulation protein RsbU (phosphoserine phosphatase)
MQILIADDDAISRSLARAALSGTGCEIVSVSDGNAAWAAIESRHQATLLVLDRVMPGIDGIELCSRARRTGPFPPLHILMVTSAGEPADITAGLDAGADDYLTKPYNREELRARAGVGLRMLALQENLARRVSELEEAIASVKQLRGLLPMCSYCKKIRVDDNYWQQLESYISDRSDAEFSHGICPECYPSVLMGHTGRGLP